MAFLGWFWRRLTLRHWRMAWGQTALVFALLAIGVGVFLAVRMANRAALVSFAQFTEAVTGQADWVVTTPAGRFRDTLLLELRGALGAQPVVLTPVVETTAALPNPGADAAAFGEGAETLTLLGLDLVGIVNLPAVAARDNRLLFQPGGEAADDSGGDGDFWARLRAPDTVFISPLLAAERGLHPGDTLRALVDERSVDLRVAALLPADPEGQPPPRNLLVMDLPAVQRLIGREGLVDRVEVLAEPGPGLAERREAARVALERAAQGRWQVEAPDARRDTGERMTAAFRLNLTVLSLIALVVGLVLVAQALEAAVVRRRQEIAVLRSLGVPPAAIGWAWLGEAALFGLGGGLLGVLVGWAGAQAAVGGISRTVNTLYQTSTAQAAALRWDDALLGLGIGLGASLLAGILPAREAAAIPPAQALQRGALYGGSLLLRRPWVGVFPLAVALLAWQAPPLTLPGGARFSLAGFVAALLAMAAACLFAAGLTPVVGRVARGLGAWSAPLRLGLSRLRAGSGRHQLAAAGLCIACGMASGMGVLIHSFERTMEHWIGVTLRGDLYAAPLGAQSASSQSRVRGETWRALAADPRVAVAIPVAAFPVQLDGKETFLVGGPLADPLREWIWVEPPAPGTSFVSAAGAIEPVFVSESFRERFGRGRGDFLEIPTPLGPQRAVIAAVYAEYGNERGTILADPQRVADWFLDDGAARLIFGLRPGVDPETLLTEWGGRHPGIVFRSNAGLRAEVLRIFRQTFAVTYALQAIGLAVALGGLALALVSLLLEARGDLTTLRALGFSRRELAATGAVEGAGVALAGFTAGTALSLFLGGLLVFVINRQSFGWTLAFEIPWPGLAAFGAAVLGLAALTGWLAGRWGAALPAEREE